MTQALYAHMNNNEKKNNLYKKKVLGDLRAGVPSYI
jgi:hypothetical protein